MAASLIRLRIGKQKVFPILCRHVGTYNKFWMAVPHMPKDTPKTNELLRSDAYPEFSKYTQMKVFTGSAKIALCHDIELTKHIKKLEDEHAAGVHHKFSDVYDRYEELMVPLNYMMNNLESMVMLGSAVGRQVQDMMPTIMERVAAARDMVTMRDWFDIIKRLTDADCADRAQRMALYQLMLQRKEMGMDLDGQDFSKMQNLVQEIVTEEMEFLSNIDLCHRHHQTKVVSLESISKLPPWLASMVSMNKIEPMRGPFSVSLDDSVYAPFMLYCEDRPFRMTIWKNKQDVCSMNMNSEQISNHQRVDELLDLRLTLANQCGYDSFSDYVLENNTMAGSVDAFYGLQQSLKEVYIDQCEEEITELQEFAQQIGFTEKLKPWDMPYYRELHQRHHYKIDGQDVVEYFPYEEVRDQAFALFGKIFSISFEDCTRDVDVYDENVKFYRVRDADTQEDLGAFYLDAYPRERKPNGYLVREGRERCDQVGMLPFSYMVLNVWRMHESAPALLTFSDLDSFFRTIGQTLQQVMNKSPYLVTSLGQVQEKDTFRVIPTFFSNIAKNPHVLKILSKHYSTGARLSDNMIDTVLRGENHMLATEIVQTLYESSLDMQLHESNDSWIDQVESIYNEFMPFKLETDDSHPCSMGQLFGYKSRPCLSYSNHWCQMVAADLYQKFDEIGFDNIDSMVELGKQFRDIYFYQNGILSSNEKFQQFVGREPSPANLIQQNRKYTPAGRRQKEISA